MLGRPVKAIVRALTDDELIIAQGVENSAREDLSLVERTVIALRLEAAGRNRAVIQQALAIDRAEPQTHFRGEGRAERFDRGDWKRAKIGRGRWQEFAEALQDKSALKRAQVAAALPAFSKAGGDERFARALSATKTTGKPQALQAIRSSRLRTRPANRSQRFALPNAA